MGHAISKLFQVNLYINVLLVFLVKFGGELSDWRYMHKLTPHQNYFLE